MRLSVFAFVVFLFSLLGVGTAWSGQGGNAVLAGVGKVYRVIDGDTFIVNLYSEEAYNAFERAAGNEYKRRRYMDPRYKSIRVRLANVDTPESTHKDASRNTAFGSHVSTEVTKLLEGQRVSVQCHDWGVYGRPICNVSHAKVGDVGAWLIEKGYSPYVTRWGNNPYFHREYQQAAARAASRNAQR